MSRVDRSAGKRTRGHGSRESYSDARREEWEAQQEACIERSDAWFAMMFERLRSAWVREAFANRPPVKPSSAPVIPRTHPSVRAMLREHGKGSLEEWLAEYPSRKAQIEQFEVLDVRRTLEAARRMDDRERREAVRFVNDATRRAGFGSLQRIQLVEPLLDHPEMLEFLASFVNNRQARDLQALDASVADLNEEIERITRAVSSAHAAGMKLEVERLMGEKKQRYRQAAFLREQRALSLNRAYDAAVKELEAELRALAPAVKPRSAAV